MRNLRIFAAASVAALTLPVLAACGSDSSDSAKGAVSGEKETLVMAAVPAESSQSLQSDFEAITKLLEKETGVKVEFQSASDYAAVIEGQRAGKIDIASYGPFSYVIAKDSGIPLEAVAAPTSDETKKPAYTSLAYVKKGSDIKGIEDLKSKKVCFVDPGSTSGYLVPTKGLMDAGLDPKADIQPIMAGGHDASLITLNDGGCDVAFAHDTMLKTLESTGQVPAGALESIWESDPITEDPIAINSDTVPAELVEKIKTAIQTKANKPALIEAGICTDEASCVLPEEIEWGYLPVTDADFDSIRDICKATKADACESVG